MKWLGRIVAVAAAALTATYARAQVTLNFDNLTFADYDQIPSNYGASLDARLTSITYRTLYSNFTLYQSYVELWNADYGDLSKVVYPASNGYVGEIMFVPTAGYGVRIISFDMAGWSQTDRTNTLMRLVDSNGTVLYDFASGGSVAIEGDLTGNRHSTFTPNFYYAGTLGIQWGNDWNVGIDNIQFQLVAIPEPGGLALGVSLASALAILLGRRRFSAAKLVPNGVN